MGYYLALGDSLAVGIQPDARGDHVATKHIPSLKLEKLGGSVARNLLRAVRTDVGRPCTVECSPHTVERRRLPSNGERRPIVTT